MTKEDREAYLSIGWIVTIVALMLAVLVYLFGDKDGLIVFVLISLMGISFQLLNIGIAMKDNL